MATPRQEARFSTITPRPRWMLPGLLLMLGALLLRLYRLGAQSLWLDEGGTWTEVTGKGWGALFSELWSTNAAYPLYHLLLKGWVALAGDSEWALRFPSALAGAAAVAVIGLAAREVLLAHNRATSTYRPLLTALLTALSPFALWQSQDAKVYSLLILSMALLLWAMLWALRRDTLQHWLIVLGVAAVSVFVHRLALLALVGALLSYALIGPHRSARWGQWARWGALLAALLIAVVAVFGLTRAVVVEGQGSSGHITAGPLQGAWLTLVHFALDRGDIGGWLGVPQLLWLLPSLALLVWGAVLLVRDALQRNAAAIVLLCGLLVPLLLFAVALARSPHYESRYMAVAFPAWLLALSYPLLFAKPRQFAASALYAVVLAVQVAVLLQPQHGQFSGAPVKEQWREAIRELALRAHPDDLVIVQPYYVMPMWAYYAPRVTPDPLPPPATFSNFGEGDCAQIFAGQPAEMNKCYQRRYEKDFNIYATGKKRMLMLIAPEHASTVDPPKTLEQLQAEAAAANRPLPTEPDRYGWLGLRFQFASDQRTWPCGGTGDAYIGVEVMCASFPEFFKAKRIPEPETPLSAVFGEELELRGYSLTPAGGELRPGGTLPITLYWQAVAPPTRDYTMFLHLCRDCESPPLAQADQRPLEGYAPAGQTTTWHVGDPVHDERSVPLPADLPPGRYMLLLGVYPLGEPSPDARLSVRSDATILGGTRLVLTEVTIGAP
jgi:mannosyltransferase